MRVHYDANNNITALDETETKVVLGLSYVNHLYTYFDYDDLNRVLAQRTKYYSQGAAAWVWSKRAHEYDGIGRLVHSTYKTWNDGSMEPAGDSLEHIYDTSGRYLQNYDGTSTYGSVWHWAGADPAPETRHALRSPNADTASQTAYNAADSSHRSAALREPHAY